VHPLDTEVSTTLYKEVLPTKHKTVHGGDYTGRIRRRSV